MRNTKQKDSREFVQVTEHMLEEVKRLSDFPIDLELLTTLKV